MILSCITVLNCAILSNKLLLLLLLLLFLFINEDAFFSKLSKLLQLLQIEAQDLLCFTEILHPQKQFPFSLIEVI